MMKKKMAMEKKSLSFCSLNPINTLIMTVPPSLSQTHFWPTKTYHHHKNKRRLVQEDHVFKKKETQKDSSSSVCKINLWGGGRIDMLIRTCKSIIQYCLYPGTFIFFLWNPPSPFFRKFMSWSLFSACEHGYLHMGLPVGRRKKKYCMCCNTVEH